MTLSRTLQVVPSEGARPVAPVYPSVPAEPVASSSVAVVVRPQPVPAPVAPATPAAPAQASAGSGLRMADVQPLLGQLLGALQSGRGDQVGRLVDRSTSQGDGGTRFVDAYNRTVDGARVVRLGGVQFAGRPGGGEQLIVDGVVQLQLQSPDDSREVKTRELVVRAQFASRGGQPVLTQLSTGDAPR